MAAHGEFAGTEKQFAVMRAILKAADGGAFVTVMELQCQFPGSKQAILSTLGTLERWGFISKNPRGHRSMELKPTGKAYSHFRK